METAREAIENVAHHAQRAGRDCLGRWVGGWVGGLGERNDRHSFSVRVSHPPTHPPTLLHTKNFAHGSSVRQYAYGPKEEHPGEGEGRNDVPQVGLVAAHALDVGVEGGHEDLCRRRWVGGWVVEWG